MTKYLSGFAIAAALVICVSAHTVAAQIPQTIKRTITKSDKLDFGAGGTVSVTGAPNGSVKIIGSSKNEIEITAVIEIQAGSEADLDRLAGVTTFVSQESTGRFSVISVGTHNKLGDKKLWKKFPKNLMGQPFRIDYTLSVPQYTDVEIDGGKGDLSISGVEGSMKINFLETNAILELRGGVTTATFGSGSVSISTSSKGWRSRALDVQIAKGDMSVVLPANLNAEIDATVLRTGKIENLITGLKPRVRKVEFTDRSIVAKAGNGGVPIKLTVGDGTLKLAAQ